MDENKLKEQEELKNLLNATDDGDESDDENGDKNKNNPDNSNKNGESDDDENGEDEQGDKADQNKDGLKDKGKDKSDKSTDRWHGKSREEIINEYESLESKHKAPDDKTKDSEELKLPAPEELQKMTPTDFAKWVLTRINEGVKQTIETQEKVRGAVRQEIEEAKKDHPLHDSDYRKMVLAIIDAASAKGSIVPLKEACEQVDAFLGKHTGQSEDISDDERSRLKKAKAQVESGAGAPTQPENSDAETQRIQKALGHGGSKGSLGGLGL